MARIDIPHHNCYYQYTVPYIAPKDRKELDPIIDELADKIAKRAKGYNYDGAFAGLINYSASRLTLKVVKKLFGQMRYWIIATVVGAFKNVADEFYRRVGHPYEEKQIKKNGDVDLYKEYKDEIEKM